jgi:hypothetical protein
MPTPAIALSIVPSFPRASAHFFRTLCGYIICWLTRKAPFPQALLCMSLAITSAVPSFHLSKPTVPLSDCLWSISIFGPRAGHKFQHAPSCTLPAIALWPFPHFTRVKSYLRRVCGHILLVCEQGTNFHKNCHTHQDNLHTTSDRVVGHLFQIGHINCWSAGKAPILPTLSCPSRALGFR